MSTPNKGYTSEGSKSWVEWLLKYRKKEYGEKFTRDIYKPNAFSSSTLAYSIDKQIKWKMGEPAEERTPEDEGKMLVGEAIHAYLQSKLSKTFICDHELRVELPFEWRSMPKEKTILIICHPDAYSLEERQLIDFKTSFGAKSSPYISESMKRQVALYWWRLNEMMHIDCDMRITKLWNEGVNEWTAKPDEKVDYSKEMMDRAFDCATRLDAEYLEKGVPK